MKDWFIGIGIMAVTAIAGIFTMIFGILMQLVFWLGLWGGLLYLLFWFLSHFGVI